MTTWSTRCKCGYESDESFDRHFEAVEDITNHLMRSDCGGSSTDTEIYERETASDD